jgi:hypothetical protein
MSYSFEEVNVNLNVIAVEFKTEKIGSSQSCEAAPNDSNLDDSGHLTWRTKLATAWIHQLKRLTIWILSNVQYSQKKEGKAPTCPLPLLCNLWVDSSASDSETPVSSFKLAAVMMLLGHDSKFYLKPEARGVCRSGLRFGHPSKIPKTTNTLLSITSSE